MTERTPPQAVDTRAFAAAAALCAEGRADLVRRGRSPEGRKRLRRFGLGEVARWLLAIEPAALRTALDADPSLPQGERDGSQRRFTLEEATTLRARLVGEPSSAPLRRPEGAVAKILAVANFKGGVGKTSTAANLAMAAALEGLRVLVVDLDSQGSMTSIFGGVVEDEWRTAFPLLARDFAREQRRELGERALEGVLRQALETRFVDVVQSTHWPSIDLVGAQLNLYWAEFQIPVWRLALRRWRLWEALANALAEEAVAAYDLVVLDTPPALGYLTLNGLAAADILLVPFGASFLEFDSTGRFFDMIHATFASIEQSESALAQSAGLGGIVFEWDSVKALITRYDPQQQAEMAELIEAYLGEFLCRHRQEHTVLVGQAAERVDALYEADPRDFNRETYARGRETFDRTWAEVRELVAAAWRLKSGRDGGRG